MDFKDFYNKTASHYNVRHDSPASRRLREKENGMVRKYARGRALDIGCGTGYHMRHEGLDTIIGVDISDEMIGIARKNGLDARKARAEHLPFPGSSFDTVFCFFAVLNMCDAGQAVKEMSRVLKPGGCALVSLSSVNDKRHFRVSRQNVVLKELFAKDGLADLFEKNGFALERFDSVFRSGRPRWGDFSRVPLRERARLWMDRFRPAEKGVVYLAAFRKMP
jgi:ubiquinone/menaquinone biosynthesis C-methylase UbiE